MIKHKAHNMQDKVWTAGIQNHYKKERSTFSYNSKWADMPALYTQALFHLYLPIPKLDNMDKKIN